jgi:hypothetical protein
VADDPTVTDFLVDQARASEHVTALVRLLLQKGVITGPEYTSALQEVVAARLLEEEPDATHILDRP